jgi:hypothetical protein
MFDKRFNVYLTMVLQMVLLLTLLGLGTYLVVYSTSFIVKTVGLLYIVVSVMLLAKRDTFLPFLGDMAFPKSLLKPSTPKDTNGSVKVRLQVANGTPVVYWASESSSTTFEDPWKAYQDYENAGVALVEGGLVEFKFRYPASYYVPSGFLIKQHVHFRVMQSNGMLSNVKTVYLEK